MSPRALLVFMIFSSSCGATTRETNEPAARTYVVHPAKCDFRGLRPGRVDIEKLVALIRKCPDSRELAVLNPPPYRPGRETVREVWLEQVELHGDQPGVLVGAAEFFSFDDPERTDDLLRRALARNKLSRTLRLRVGDLYLRRADLGSGETRKADARLAYEVMSTALGGDTGRDRHRFLEGAARASLLLGDLSAAEVWARELLEKPNARGGLSKGDVLHKGNILLGTVALRRGQLRSAKSYLLAAATGPTSPVLRSFGPRMSLALELLDAGERGTVVDYLRACRRIWDLGHPKIDLWIKMIERGDTPDFGSNLYY